MSSNSVTHLFRHGTLGERSFARRAAGLSRSERAVYRRVLRRIIEGTTPALDALAGGEIAPLIEANLIQTDDGDRLTTAYPFSARPTRHRVILHVGRSFHAMCAIDALGIPYMLDERSEVESREPEADRVVRVTIDPDWEPAWTPTQAVAVAAFGEGSCLAQAACPHINLFTAPGAATRCLNANTLRGSILSIPEAATTGRWLFGDLLDSLDDAEAR
jgi:hypothetical protein